MAIVDQLHELTIRKLNELTRAADYYTHSEAAWRLVQRHVRAGYKVRIQNVDTGTDIDGPALSVLSEGYISGYLAESLFQHYVSLFEDYTFALIGHWLMAYPQGIVGLEADEGDDKLKKTDKLVPMSFIIDNSDRDSILRAVIERELDRLKYRRLTAWFDYLNKRAKLGAPSRDQIERLAELKASRDVLAHNGGIVNQTYINKAGNKARYADGDRLEIKEPYLRESWLLIAEVVRQTSKAAISKFEKPSVTPSAQTSSPQEPPAPLDKPDN